MDLNSSLLRRSFQPILPIADEFVDHFYEELFRSHSELRALISIDLLSEQKSKWAQFLGNLVEHVEDRDLLRGCLRPGFEWLSKRGITLEQVKGAGETLIKTLKYFYADNWTAELNATWTNAAEHVLLVLESFLREQKGPAPQEQNLSKPEVKMDQMNPVSEKESQLRQRIDQLASQVLLSAMQQQAQAIAAQVIFDMKDTILSQMIQEEVKRQAAQWVAEIIKTAVETEASKLIFTSHPRVESVA